MTTQTTSDGSPQVLTKAGPSLPVIITLDSQQAALRPTIGIISSADGNYTGFMEITLDRPDASGNLPSPGNWMPYEDFSTGGGAISSRMMYPSGSTPLGYYNTVKSIISAVRVNLTAIAAGSCTFSVGQAVIPKLHGGL